MNKSRLEAFSDGVFAIAMTLLVIELHLPALPEPVTNGALWNALFAELPQMFIYGITFTVLAVFWINHHFLFHTFAKAVDRRLNLLNLGYLMTIAFVPFSASVLGEHLLHQPAALLYGVNILAAVLFTLAMLTHIRRNEHLLNDDVSSRITKQARIRTAVSLVCYCAGLVLTAFWVPASIALFVFPIVFNIIPGTLDAAERVFGFTLE